MDAISMDHEPCVLPGFRFHPTDEELVSFYLRRKIEKKFVKIEFINQMDIYKYDPWDLPKNKSSVTADKEWYFFCKRGRKYRNSIRPNRVTGSGFWKATGIDKPIYSVETKGCHDCIIGLKKSLVFYRGSAGKGTKTDWMMHEFRLPGDRKNNASHLNANTADEDVEIWTLCRIFKRNSSHRKYTPDWREESAKSKPIKKYSSMPEEGYICFGAQEAVDGEKKPSVVGDNIVNIMNERNQFIHAVVSEPESCSSTVLNDEAMEFFAHANWDEIVPTMDYANFDHDPYHF